MIDLDIVTMQQCKKLSTYAMEVDGYQITGLGDERTWPACTCDGYRNAPRVNFGGQQVPTMCAHILKAQHLIGCWHEQWSPERQTPEQRERLVCPRCGGPTEWVSVGV